MASESIFAIEAFMKENRRIILEEIAAVLKMNLGSVYHIMHDIPFYHKESARWVSKQLTPELKQRCIDFVTGDEPRVQYHQSESKRTSKEFHRPSSPKPKKFRTELST